MFDHQISWHCWRANVKSLTPENILSPLVYRRPKGWRYLFSPKVLRFYGIKIFIEMSSANFLIIEEVVVVLLLIASAVAIVARRLRIPYTVGLVLIGLALGLLTAQEIQISPQLILALLVPPLVFDAAFHIRLEDLRRDFWFILLLAVQSMILTSPFVGWLFKPGTGPPP